MRTLVIVALLAACDGGDVPVDDLETEVIDAICDLYVRCGLIEDSETCHEIYDLDVDIDPNVVAAIDAGKVIYHADEAKACLATLTEASCERTSLLRSNDSEACANTFEGTVAGGGMCAIDEECISQNCDTPDCPVESCCQGTCIGDVRVPRPRVGEACAMTFNCVDSYCNGTTCQPYVANGGMCQSSQQCASFSCVNTMCVPLVATGGPCTTSSNCANLGDTCNMASMTCVAAGLAGDPCTSARDCSELYICGTSGTCTLRPRLGETCDQQALRCIDASYCEPTTLKCAALKADSAPCTANRECASGECNPTTMTCFTPPICI